MCQGPSNWCVANAHTHTTRGGGFTQIPCDSPKALSGFTRRQEFLQTPSGAGQPGRLLQLLLCATPASAALRLPGLQRPPGLRRAGGCAGLRWPRLHQGRRQAPRGAPPCLCPSAASLEAPKSDLRPSYCDERETEWPLLPPAWPLACLCSGSAQPGGRRALPHCWGTGPEGRGRCRTKRQAQPSQALGCVGSAGAGGGRPQPLTGQPRTHRSIPLSLSVARSVTVSQMMHRHNSDRGQTTSQAVS